MNVTVIGEEIFLGGEKVATVEASTVSLAEDFKQWVEEKNGDGDLSEEIEDLRDENSSLTEELEEAEERYGRLIDDLRKLKEHIDEIWSNYE